MDCYIAIGLFEDDKDCYDDYELREICNQYVERLSANTSWNCNKRSIRMIEISYGIVLNNPVMVWRYRNKESKIIQPYFLRCVPPALKFLTNRLRIGINAYTPYKCVIPLVKLEMFYNDLYEHLVLFTDAKSLLKLMHTQGLCNPFEIFRFTPRKPQTNESIIDYKILTQWEWSRYNTECAICESGWNIKSPVLISSLSNTYHKECLSLIPGGISCSLSHNHADKVCKITCIRNIIISNPINCSYAYIFAPYGTDLSDILINMTKKFVIRPYIVL